MNVRYLIVCFLLSGLVPARQSHAQFNLPSSLTVRLGEQVPPGILAMEFDALDCNTGQDKKIRLSDFDDKLIILDFWANWCGACIGSLKKLDTLQRLYGDEPFVVIPVTNDKKEKAWQAAKRWHWKLVSIVGDTLWNKVFPTSSIPHQVWLKAGKVVAIPHHTYATIENIKKVNAGLPINMVSKTGDRIPDPMQPIFMHDTQDSKVLFRRPHAVITAWDKSYIRQSLRFVQKNDTSILYCTNLPFPFFIYETFQSKIFPLLDWRSGSGIFYEMEDSLRKQLVKAPKLSKNGNYDQDLKWLNWQTGHTFCYELRYPGIIDSLSAINRMQQHVKAFFLDQFGLKLEVQEKARHAYAALEILNNREETIQLLKATDTVKRREIKDGFEYFNYWDFWRFHFFISEALGNVPDLGLTLYQLVDRTGIDRNLKADLVMPANMTQAGNLEPVHKALARYGLNLTIEEKRLPVLVVQKTW